MAPPLRGGGRRGRLSYLLCRGAAGGRCAGTQPGGNYSSGNYSSGVVRGDDATLQEWQGWLASLPGAPATRQAGTGLIQPCPASGSSSPCGGSRIFPAEHPRTGLLWMFPLPAADRELLPCSKRGDIPVTWCPGPLNALCS